MSGRLQGKSADYLEYEQTCPPDSGQSFRIGVAVEQDATERIQLYGRVRVQG